MPTKAALRDSALADRTDDDLVELARRTGNDDGAFEELYRRHENGARNVARHILRSRHDADDVVNEAFAGVIAAISHGAGPRSNFRQYLMACVRNSCKSRRWCGRSISTDPALLERDGAVFEDPERLSEAGLVANAFSSLSPDWQQTLWMTAVEERPTAEIAEQLGRRPAAVAALAHRAREAFAEAYLAQHQLRVTEPACARISPKLAHYVRGRSGDVDSVLVERHLVDCVACSCAVAEMRDLNASLRTLTGPAPLVGVGVAAAGMASMVGFLPIGAAGGWGIGALSGAAVAKLAVLGALLVPAAVVAASSSPTTPTASPTSPTTAGTTGRASSAVGAVGAAAADTAIATVPTAVIDPLFADIVLGTPDPIGSNHSTGEGSPGGDAGTVLTGAATTGLPVVTIPGLPTTVPPVQVGATLPPDGGAKIGGSSGGVSVDVTIPIVTIPISIDIPLPSLELPALAVPSLSTPEITTAPIVIPSLSVPDLGLPLPPLSTPEISIPALQIPSLTTPAIALPEVTLPAVTLPPITIPDVLGSLLPPITIPKILGG